jgi:hypothetical protein
MAEEDLCGTSLSSLSLSLSLSRSLSLSLFSLILLLSLSLLLSFTQIFAFLAICLMRMASESESFESELYPGKKDPKEEDGASVSENAGSGFGLGSVLSSVLGPVLDLKGPNSELQLGTKECVQTDKEPDKNQNQQQPEPEHELLASIECDAERKVYHVFHLEVFPLSHESFTYSFHSLLRPVKCI